MVKDVGFFRVFQGFSCFFKPWKKEIDIAGILLLGFFDIGKTTADIVGILLLV